MSPFQPHKIPDGMHPLVKALFETMNQEQCSVVMLAERTGIDRNTIGNWKKRAQPSVTNLDACWTALGYRLTIRKR